MELTMLLPPHPDRSWALARQMGITPRSRNARRF
jgi:hypothetical protein